MAGEREIFHITTEGEWAAAQAEGVLRPPSLDREGFIHCSTGEQVPHTLARFFAGQQGLILLRLDEAQLGAALVFEAPSPPLPNEPGARFPHLYAPLPVAAVLEVRPV